MWDIEWDSNGYPDAASLRRLSAHSMDFGAAARFIANGLGAKASRHASLTFSEGKDGFTGEPVRFVLFSTGGWSGNEDLISAAMNRFDVAHFLRQWNAGGHYQFEVPLAFLEGPLPETQRT